MDDPILKTVPLRARIRSVDHALLKALCARRGCNLSEMVRQAIRNEADREGLYCVAGFITKREVQNADQPK
jgi:hypothetical protein